MPQREAQRPRVAVVGDAGWDLTFQVTRGADEKYDVRRTLRSVGGTGANAAAVCSSLGTTAHLVATVGTDAIAESIEGGLALVVAEQDLARVPGQSEMSVITIAEDGDRAVLVDLGVAEQLDATAAARAASQADWVYLSAVAPPLLRAVLSSADPTRVVVSLEARHLLADWGDLIERCGVLITNSAGQRALGTRGTPPVLAVTRGATGVDLAIGGRFTRVPSPAVVEVDGTGAGDAFGGALVALLAQGLDVPAAVTLAAAAGALTAASFGAQSRLPTLSDLERLLR